MEKETESNNNTITLATDPNELRLKSIRQLVETIDHAHKMSMKDGLDESSKERWAQRHTSAVLVLNQLLRDLQYNDYEVRLRKLEIYWKKQK